MNYEFHVGDYVKTRAGYIGYIESIHDLLHEVTGLYVRFVDGDCHCFEVTDKTIASNFLRIGAYDFTKKEKKKIEQLEKDLPIEIKVGDKVTIMKQYIDGNYNTIIYNTKMIDKINELVNTVNLLLDKSTES
jgi:hypothetical protein